MPKENVTRGYGLLEEFLAKQRCRIASKLMPPVHGKGRILDIGCGMHPLFLLSTSFAEKYGLEKFHPQDHAHLKDQGLTIVCRDMEKETELPFPSNFFNVVTMLAVFEHMEPDRLAPLIKEIHRVLRPEGVYILTTPAFWTDGLLRVLARLKIVSSVEIDEHKAAYSHSSISRLLQNGGFLKGMLRFGYFEMFMNIWATATKQRIEAEDA